MRRNSGIGMESTKKNRIKMSYDRTGGSNKWRNSINTIA